jgi:lysophospholipase L1-like esterase
MFRKRLASGLFCLVLLVSSFLPLSATARSSEPTAGPCPEKSTILSGLWAGVNATSDTAYNCDGRPIARERTDQSPAEPVDNGIYVALGDSVAAGLGLPRLPGADSACGVSGRAYPAQVARGLNATYLNLACSGATVGDLFTEQHLSGTSRDIEPQLDRAFAGGIPSVITLTAGANDVQWPYFVRKCYVDTCGTSRDDAVAASLREALRYKLTFALSAIDYYSNGQPPQVLVTGYYRPFSTACQRQQSEITRSEITWLHARTHDLNRTIANVAGQYSFAKYVPISFRGHELCTSAPWIQGVDDPAPFHPTAQGQATIARAMLASIER